MNLVGAFIDECVKLARKEEPKWSEVIVSTPDIKLTKKDVFNYYSEPRVRRAIMGQLKGREAVIRQSFTPERVILKRHEIGKPIRITKDKRNPYDVKDYSYFTERRVTEFHPVFKKSERQVFVDLDPREGLSLEEVKGAVREVEDILEKRPEIASTEVRFSGGRGFYVVGNLKRSMNINKARGMLKRILKPLEEDERITMGIPESDQIRLDVTPLKTRGSLRGLFSLNSSTGLVSVPVEDLDAFDPKKDATIEAVLGRKPRSFRHVR